MDRFGETRIWLLDAELELAPISAHELLSARTESRELFARYAEDGGMDKPGERLCLGACVLARGLYDGEKRVFSSGGEVLEGLTADEIILAAGEYAFGELPEFKDKAVSGGFVPSGAKADPAGAADEAEPSENAGGLSDGPVQDWENTSDWDEPGLDPFDSVRVSEDGMDNAPRPADEAAALYGPLKKRGTEKGLERYSGQGHGADTETVRVIRERVEEGSAEAVRSLPRGRPLETGRGAGRDIQAISDFFERDSRRYSGEFELY